MKENLTDKEYQSVSNSYFNILALFLGKEHVESKYVACLLKWAVQLGLGREELRTVEESFDSLAFRMPSTHEDKLDAIFDLVQMIYLDNVVEDIELEVASLYAKHLGFEKYVVGELFQSIATAPYDGKNVDDVKSEIKKLLSDRK